MPLTVIQSVDSGSPAHRAGVKAGETLAEINGHPVWDVLDYKYYSYDARLVLTLRGEDGAITAVTTDTAALNRLRAQLLGAALAALDGVDVTQIQIPLGSLLDFDLLWGLGPTVKVHAMTVGTAAGEFSSKFSSAGVNQTLHRISLELEIPLTLMLPGGRAEAVCRTDVPIAETVIVGRVPDTYLQLN